MNTEEMKLTLTETKIKLLTIWTAEQENYKLSSSKSFTIPSTRVVVVVGVSFPDLVFLGQRTQIT